VISADNARRYATFVDLVEHTDTERVVELYVRFYPLFQRAYEDLGYPGRYFNDRVVEVIDSLLATAVTAEPIKVERLRVDGGSARDGGLFVFADPTIEVRPAGRKAPDAHGSGECREDPDEAG
jgi:hypothetical protein